MALRFMVLSPTPQLDLTVSPYALLSVDLGEATREEVWVVPPPSPAPWLVNYAERKTQMTIRLEVTGTTPGSLISNCEKVRDKFSQTNAVIEYSLDYPSPGVTTMQIPTYPSMISPIISSRERSLYTANRLFLIPEWVITLWRAPNPVGTNVPMIG